jgi:transcriptional regulator with XRE-family HTH domain
MKGMKEVGNLLRQTRESQGVEIEHVARELKVRPDYLEILESGDVRSVSKEIYILGYLKSYASWLGLNSNEITNQFKSFNGDLSVSKGAHSDSMVFLKFDERLLSSNSSVYLFCIFFLCLFFFLERNSDSLSAAIFDESYFIISKVNENPYAGFSFKKDVNNKIMLVATKDLTIKLNYSDNYVENKYISLGEVYFLDDNKDVLISSDSPHDVDIFTDDTQGKYLGTLKDFYMYN